MRYPIEKPMTQAMTQSELELALATLLSVPCPECFGEGYDARATAIAGGRTDCEICHGRGGVPKEIHLEGIWLLALKLGIEHRILEAIDLDLNVNEEAGGPEVALTEAEILEAAKQVFVEALGGTK